jgi:hypothetical protein
VDSHHANGLGGRLVIMQGVLAVNGDSVSSSIASLFARLLLVLLDIGLPCALLNSETCCPPLFSPPNIASTQVHSPHPAPGLLN